MVLLLCILGGSNILFAEFCWQFSFSQLRLLEHALAQHAAAILAAGKLARDRCSPRASRAGGASRSTLACLLRACIGSLRGIARQELLFSRRVYSRGISAALLQLVCLFVCLLRCAGLGREQFLFAAFGCRSWGCRQQALAVMAGLLKKKARTRGDPKLLASELQKVFEGVLKTQGNWDLNHFLRHFERTTWKTSPSLSVPGLAATEELWRELLLLEPTGVP